MGFISKRGSEVTEAVTKADVDLKKVFIRLKDGESIRVRLLSIEDYVQYKAHSNGFSLGIYSQPCLTPVGKDCPLCKAYEYDKEAYKDLRPSYRYLVAMADLDNGAIRVWDCSKLQLKGFISQVLEYKDEINDSDNEMMFTFKRTGSKTDTTYTLSPIINKKVKADLTDAYHNFDGTVVEDTFFESCIVPRTEDLILTALNQAGLPVKEIFPEYEEKVEESITPESDGDLPF